MRFTIKKIIPYLVAILLFSVVSVTYFYPVLEGKKIFQNDIKQFIGMAKETNDFRAENSTEPYWTNGAFSGMPTYNVTAYYPNDYIKKIDSFLRFLPRPADYLFLYFISFFILLMVLKVDWKLALIGSLAFGFSTYYIIILGVGHNAKAHAIAYMPMVLAGILLVFKRKWFLGFLLTAIAMALEIKTGHIQMTYYLLFLVLILGAIYCIEAYKNKKILLFFKQIAVLLVAVTLAVGVNANSLLATKEYSKYSTRGKSELTINPDGSKKENTLGLSKEYITEYSYGKLETFNLLIPRFMGGGTVENIGKNSNTYNFLKDKIGVKKAKDFSEQVLTYWGKQPIVEAPAYIGAILFFLFFVGVFLVKKPIKKVLVVATIFSILLSWGKNFPILTDFFINYVPLYSKFRAVTSIQVIAELCVPLLGILAMQKIISEKVSAKEKQNALKKGLYIFIGLVFSGFLLAHFTSNFEGIRDAQYQQLSGLADAVILDRKQMLLVDSLRSVFLVVALFLVIWFFIKQRIKKTTIILVVAILVLFDLVMVDKRYVNANDFMSAQKIEKPFIATEIDKEILKDTTYYRVANFSVNPMNDGSTSYFHKSIGGYHAAKMRRYQDIFDFHIAKNNIEVLNMLNTKYFIFTDSANRLNAQENIDTNGNVWLVREFKKVQSPNEEIKALDSINTKKTAILNTNEFKEVNTSLKGVDTTATISLKSYAPNYLQYIFSSKTNQTAVFSEVYYKDGWNAYVNGNLTPHFRVNYILRALQVPKGEHTIEFRFEPKVIRQGKTITLISYFLLFIIPVGGYFILKRKK